MPTLTEAEEKRLQLTGDLVRMYVAVLSVIAPLLCVYFANDEYRAVISEGGIPEIPPGSTYGTITGIYLPLFLAAGAFIWAVKASKQRPLAPNGYRIAMFRDAFTVFVMSVVLGIPVLLYMGESRIQEVNTLLVWYQGVLAATAGGAFTYYFNAARSALAAQRAEEPRRVPAAEHKGVPDEQPAAPVGTQPVFQEG